MENLLDNLVKTANSFVQNRKDDGNFDYSLDSLKDIDNLLKVIGENGLEQHELDIWTSFISSYVFEVARKIEGGDYIFDEDTHQPMLICNVNDGKVTLLVWSKLAGILSQTETGSMVEHLKEYSNEIDKAKSTAGHTSTIL